MSLDLTKETLVRLVENLKEIKGGNQEGQNGGDRSWTGNVSGKNN